MFWRFGFHTQSSVDALLDRDNATLEELFEEEELLQECKAQNKKLIDFLCTTGRLDALLHYIIDEPDASLSEETKYKFPMFACEVLCCDVLPIYDTLFLNKELLQDFWKFLENPVPLNPLQGSFFIRVFAMLLQRKIPHTLEFIKNQPNAVGDMIKHIGLSAMMDMILRITSCEEVKEGEGIVVWLCENGLIQQLAEKLDADQSPEVNNNVAQLLVDILNTAHAFGANKNVMLDLIKSKKICETIMKGIMKPDAPNFISAVYHGLSVFIELIQRYAQSVSSADETPHLDISEMVEVVLPYLADLHAVMDKPYVAPGELAETTFPKSKPLGLLRLRIIEFFSALLHTNNKDVFAAYVKLQMMPYYVQLFFKYPLHNFLHTLVQDVVIKTLTTDPAISGDLVVSLLKDSGITDKIVQAAHENEGDVAKEWGAHRGYMGHITLIASELEKFSQGTGLDNNLAAVFEKESWKEYVTKFLAETKERDSKPLGGHRPTPVQEDPLGEVIFGTSSQDDLSSSDKFSRFLASQITTSMPDDFGSHDMEEDDVNDMDADYAHSSISFNPFDMHKRDTLSDDDKHFYQDQFANFGNAQFNNADYDS